MGIGVNEFGKLVGFEELGNWRVNDEAQMMSSE